MKVFATWTSTVVEVVTSPEAAIVKLLKLLAFAVEIVVPEPPLRLTVPVPAVSVPPTSSQLPFTSIIELFRITFPPFIVKLPSTS